MTPPAPPRRIVVIGAGIVGACIAVELVARGHAVTIVEPAHPGADQAASYGNGAFISPASILPMSFPGMWRRVPGYLLDPAGPLTIRWRDLPGLAPWLWRFVLSGATEARWRRTAGHLHSLLHDAPARHLALAARTGLGDLIRQGGLIYAFPSREAWQAEAAGWQIRAQHGVAMQELTAEDLARLAPGLAPRYRFGILIREGAHCTDPGGYTAGLVHWATAHGARHMPASATGFAIRQGRLSAVQTTGGDLPCDGAVIAAGIHSATLARKAGDRVRLTAERGYHVQLPDPPVCPAIPVMPQDGKMANTLTRGGLRAAGQVELARPGAPPDWRRADILLRHLRATWPALATHNGPVQHWQGDRPSTPDGLPVISRAGHIAGLVHAFGHGHIGLASAPVTAEIVADLIEGRAPRIDPAPCTIARFGKGRLA